MAAAQGNPLETELNTYRAIQKEIGKVQGNISTAQTQILENEMVLKVCIPLSRYGLLKGRGRRVPTRGRRERLHVCCARFVAGARASRGGLVSLQVDRSCARQAGVG